jgi:hypothetical protein
MQSNPCKYVLLGLAFVLGTILIAGLVPSRAEAAASRTRPRDAALWIAPAMFAVQSEEVALPLQAADYTGDGTAYSLRGFDDTQGTLDSVDIYVTGYAYIQELAENSDANNHTGGTCTFGGLCDSSNSTQMGFGVERPDDFVTVGTVTQAISPDPQSVNFGPYDGTFDYAGTGSGSGLADTSIASTQVSHLTTQLHHWVGSTITIKVKRLVYSADFCSCDHAAITTSYAEARGTLDIYYNYH